MGIFDFIFKREKARQIKKVSVIADQIEALAEKYASFSDEQLRSETAVFKERLASGESLDDILPEAYAVVREASARVLNMRHFYVQLIGGIVLHQGRIAEMKTGEGKTLVETLPAYLNALTGKGVHIVTVNDYLAKRDAEWMGKVFVFLGLTVGVSLNNMSKEEKKAAYAADITYCTNNELGFDYLRDNMVRSKNDKCLRGLNYVIIDEIDSILIDEARTPLIISGQSSENSELYKKVSTFIRRLDEEDYEVELKENQISLSESGIEKAEEYFNIENLGDLENGDLNQKIQMGLRAHKLMQRDKDYIIDKGQVLIVDEFTGRVMASRRYSNGLHQSIEAKEGVPVRNENRTVATITFQNLFRLYNKISGMTGTAMTEEAEFKGIYELDVVEIPTNKDMIRVDEPDKIYPSMEAKYQAVIEDIKATHAKNQPILVGTVDVDVSEDISRRLSKINIKHNVLNAKNNENEAHIIAQAGKFGAVTIATNMAGRGTDILLGGNPEALTKEQMEKEGFDPAIIEIASAHNTLTDETEIAARARFESLKEEFSKETEKEKEQVVALGGLRVIGVTRHESRRIDNQLRGRAGRQGDPGSSCFYLSFEDSLVKRFGGDRMKSLVESLGVADDMVIQMPLLARQIESAQKRCEEQNYSIRRYTLNYDDVMNKQRELIYSQRDEVLDGVDVHEQIEGFFESVLDGVMEGYRDFSEEEEGEESLKAFNRNLEDALFLPNTDPLTMDDCVELDKKEIREKLFKAAIDEYERKCAFGSEHGIDIKETERRILLNAVDKNWVDHIDQMDALRSGIGLRSYAQLDPIMEYRREGMDMFDRMVDEIKRMTVYTVTRWDVEKDVEILDAYKIDLAKRSRKPVTSQKATDQSGRKIGPNSPCPCGSGKKYKNCCGK